MLLDRIYRKVKNFVNTDVYGNVEPTDFESFVHDAIQSRNEEYFYDLNRLENKANRGLIRGGVSNLTERYSEKILHYLVESDPINVVDGYVDIPSDCRYITEPENQNGIPYEFCKNKKSFNVLKSTATATYPIYLMVGNKLRIAPAPESGGVVVSYLRKIKYPKWTYNEVQKNEVFNPDSEDFVDADIHPSEEDEIVRRVLMRFGINLKTEDISSYALNEEKSEFNENNAS